MKKSIALLIVLVMVPAVFAQVVCDDNDDGPESLSTPEPYITIKGKVKYGITEKSDTCVYGEDSYSVAEGYWVREYFCEELPDDTFKRSHRDYDCLKYGYEKCVDGECVGKEEKTEEKKPKLIELPRCGDKDVNPVYGEQCDPPDKICYLDGKIGICTDRCKCKLYEGGEQEENQTQDEQEPEEEPEQQAEPEEEPEETPEEKPTEERKPLPEEYTEPKNVGFFRKLSNSFKHTFKWMFGWLR